MEECERERECVDVRTTSTSVIATVVALGYGYEEAGGWRDRGGDGDTWLRTHDMAAEDTQQQHAHREETGG